MTEAQRDRARRWQSERMRALIERIEAGDNPEVSQAEIDSLFQETEDTGGRHRKTR